MKEKYLLYRIIDTGKHPLRLEEEFYGLRLKFQLEKPSPYQRRRDALIAGTRKALGLDDSSDTPISSN